MITADRAVMGQRRVLGRAGALLSSVLLFISLGLVWFRFGGGSRGTTIDSTGFQVLLKSFGIPPGRTSGFSWNSFLAGGLPFIVILCAAVALLLLVMVPTVRWARPLSVILAALAILAPLNMALFTFLSPKTTSIQPALWFIFVAAVTGLCASIVMAESDSSTTPGETNRDDATGSEGSGTAEDEDQDEAL
ncbi:hypothetical protein [Psychromicrobium xiongbiense]|uniref:hypothetical protein n=1 Tax=Psychromicrobium xiongbiense TaxID=3051184 RepID=UPI0025535032|nr:hypothetical protein [Psychromicrobium sp. YIM S02556]